MKNVGGTSEYIAFFDECGDHTLELIDKDFPLFLLATVVVSRVDYVGNIIPALARLKLKYWVHEGVNLHSRDIRKARGPFGFLQVPEAREAFMSELTVLMRSSGRKSTSRAASRGGMSSRRKQIGTSVSRSAYRPRIPSPERWSHRMRRLSKVKCRL